MKVEENVPFSTITTFKVGGSVRYIITIEHEEDLVQAVHFAKDVGLPLIPLGGGSNMLGRDGVLDAVFVTLVGTGSIEETATGIRVGAGVRWDSVAEYAVKKGMWGVENLSGIPGTVGGAVVQNIGAYGAVLSETMVSVDAFDTHDLKRVTFPNKACGFGYRASIFKQQTDRYVILCAELVLSKTPQPKLAYKDLVEHFVGRGVPSLPGIRSAVIEIRGKKFPPLADVGTAGSFFLNPIVTSEEAAAVQRKYPAMPVFPLPEGGVKVPIAWFLDHVLKLRGVREGNVEAWRDHVLAIVAHSGASATEVRTFAKKISDRAQSELHITIEPEVRFL